MVTIDITDFAAFLIAIAGILAAIAVYDLYRSTRAVLAHRDAELAEAQESLRFLRSPAVKKLVIKLRPMVVAADQLPLSEAERRKLVADDYHSRHPGASMATVLDAVDEAMRQIEYRS